MYKYYIWLAFEYIEVERQFFYDLLELYSSKFYIWKYDIDLKYSCESELSNGENLFYYIYDPENSNLRHFAKVIKVTNE